MTEVYVPSSEVQQCRSSFLRRKDVCGLKLQCWNVKVLVVMFCGHLRAAEEPVSVMMLVSPLVSNAVVDRKPTGRVYLVFYRPLSWLCKVMFFFKEMLFKTCLHVKIKNTKFTMQERTLWRLCTIVILLMCKYMPMFGMLLLFISCKWKKNSQPQSNTSPLVSPRPSDSWSHMSFLKLRFTMSKYDWNE